jgi:anti-anti-sigma factor
MSNKPFVVRLPSELTVDNVESARREILAELSGSGVLDTPVALVMDLSNVIIITTPGLGLILELRRRILSSGGKVILAAASHVVEDVIRRTQLDRVFDVTPTLDEALKRVQ